ncbi:hypothetical protein GCM10028797_22710 [Dyella agri]
MVEKLGEAVTKHSISAHATFVGEWFLPSEEGSEQRIAGTLTWSSEHASLELHKSLVPLQGAVYGDEIQTYPVIHGTTIESQYITVLNALRTNNNFSFGPAGVNQSERVISSWVVIGAHVTEQTLYGEVRVRIPGLQMWLSRPSIKQTVLTSEHGNALTILYEIGPLPEELCEIPSQRVTLGWGIETNHSGDQSTDISVRSSGWLRVKSSEPKPLEWFINQVGKATTLLSLLAGSPMSLDAISAKIVDYDVNLEVLVALRADQHCECKSLHEFYMLRSGLGVDFRDVFARWFENYETVGMPSQLALSVLSSEKLWLHVEFLSLMQALEGFHRATMPGLYTTEVEYEPVRHALSNAIPSSVKPDHKDALKSRIKYGNEISLRKRLDALADRLALPLRKMILGGDGNVPRSWVATRNYYTHWDDASREGTLDGPGMHRASFRMRHLIRALYLDFAGVPQEAILRSLVNTCRESQYLIQLNNAEVRRNHPGAQVTPLMQIGVDGAGSSGGQEAE